MDTETHRQIHRTTTVTFIAHVQRGLIRDANRKDLHIQKRTTLIGEGYVEWQ